MQKKWLIQRPDPRAVQDLCDHCGCLPPVAAVLVNRNLLTPEAVRRFLHPSLKDLRPPAGIADLPTAVTRIARAISERQKILVFGDYDVDGITATLILHDFLQAAGADATYYIPHRMDEGYSLQPTHVADIAQPRGVDLIITVDCGSAGHEAVAAAGRAGIDVIVTDHHEISSPLPPAVAVVNPKRGDDATGLESLAGVGVVFYLLAALRSHLGRQGLWNQRPEPNLKRVLDLVALGTVADMVPLTGANRIFTRVGLDIIQRGSRPGLQALAAVSGIDARSADSDDIAFRLAPRLNAAGRMRHAERAVALLCAASLEAARPLAADLQRLNLERQRAEQAMLDRIQARFEAQPTLLEAPALVFADPHLHLGIAGIVASRLVNAYGRPAVLISLQNGHGRGSARSIPGVDLTAALEACGRHLDGFGGHAMAAGLRLAATEVDAFQRQFADVVGAMVADRDLRPTLAIDCELDLGEVTPALIDALEALQPFGTDNPKPLFFACDVHVADAKLVAGRHRRLLLQPAGRPDAAPVNGIQFNIDPQGPPPRRFARLAFNLQWNRWNGSKTAQLIVRGVQGATEAP